MTHTEIITRTPPGRLQRIAAFSTAALMLVVAAIALPSAGAPLPACPGFLPALAGMTWIGDIMTAVLLFSQAQAVMDRSTAQLGTAYLFSGVAIVPNLLTYPGIFSIEPLLGAAASSVWLWCFWHVGFSVCTASYALRRGSAGTGKVQLTRTLLTVAAVVLVLTLISTAGLPLLPGVRHGDVYRSLTTTCIGPAALACSAGALGIVVFRLRGRTTVDLWVAVAMLTCTLDIALSLHSGSRFTLGWYISRVMSLATGLIVLIALVSEVASMFRRMMTMNGHLRQLSATDGLTGMANRRAFDEALTRTWALARREQTAISLLMLDIDQFKHFNDTYGHPAGDECIRRVAAVVLSHARRPGDMAARLGGEEFGLLLPTTEEAGIAMIAESIRAAVEALGMANVRSHLGSVSISGGIATLRPFMPDEGAANLTEAADQALYRSKTTGRNRISALRGAMETFAMPALEMERNHPACSERV